MIEFLAPLGGAIVGAALWLWLIKPVQEDKHERRRREVGLPPKRRLPEDDSVR